jgi:hypothetical protein
LLNSRGVADENCGYAGAVLSRRFFPASYIRVDWTHAGQVLDPIKAAPEAALQKLRRCGYFSLAA